MGQSTGNTVLVVGASGVTGQLLVEQLLNRALHVRAIVRSPDRLPKSLRSQPNLSVIQADLLALREADLKELTRDCDAVASCLGHNMSLKGIFGPPYRLVAETTRRLSKAVTTHRRDTPARFVLMNTAANHNRDLQETASLGQRLAVGLIRLMIPPHADNEKAADFLRLSIGQNHNALEWCAIRPDTLTNQTGTTEFEVFPSPVRSPIFDPGKTSRLNAARFMADLITVDDVWIEWRGKMPVIYDKA